MPPEALEEKPKYTAALDIFSFGNLALYAIVQEFPYPTFPTYPDPKKPKKLIARSEIERRSRQMEKMWSELGERHSLAQLVKQCLQNTQQQRPTTQALLQQLEAMRAEVQESYESMSKLELIMALKEKEEGPEAQASHTPAAQVSQLQVPVHIY